MWPWGHLAVGYLLFSLLRRRQGRRPAAPEVFLVLVGTQFADLVDKPLAWHLGALPSGRSLAHSLLVVTLVLAVLYVVLAPRIGRSPVVAFGVGWLSHPVADFPFERALAGEFEFVNYLLWPLLTLPEYDTDPSFIAHLAAYELGPLQVLEFALLALAAYVWVRDGRPGWAELRGVVRRDRPETSRR